MEQVFSPSFSLKTQYLPLPRFRLNWLLGQVVQTFSTIPRRFGLFETPPLTLAFPNGYTLKHSARASHSGPRERFSIH